MTSARFAEERLDGATNLVVVTGELDMTNVGDLRRRTAAALAEGLVHIVVDLTGVTHMDSSGLAELLTVHQNAEDAHGGLALVVTSRAITRTLQIRGVDGLFRVAPSREEARRLLAA